jgi:hypothetical protein
MMPIRMLIMNDSQTPGTPQILVQPSNENAFQLVLYLPSGLLKLNTATTAIGTNK